ncbi:MAG TPA: hypothetical protein VN317_01940, partial [Candidatus Methanoperedens sp.]|nr:hypothetical protein [Candidatus Methanoperedens sp.]
MDRSAMGTPAAPDRRRWGRLAAALYFLLVAAVAGVALRQPASFEDPVEGFLISWRFRLRDAYWRFRNPDVDWRERARVAKRLPALPPEVAIVVIDERSIARYGS